MRIRFFAAAAAATGVEEQQLDLGATPAFTLAELSGLLAESFPASASAGTPPLSELLTRCSFLINEVAARDLGAALAPDDVVDVLPPFAGG